MSDDGPMRDEAGLVKDLTEAMDLAMRRMEEASRLPRVMFFDLENGPITGVTWKLFDTHIIGSAKGIIEDWKLLSVAWKWMGEDNTNVMQLPDTGPGYPDDFGLTAFIHSLLDQADIVVAHNADKFDLRKARSKFQEHGFGEPSPFQVVDTLKVARRSGRHSSNALDALGDLLGVGRKIQKGVNMDLWYGCMANDPDAWERMGEYAQQDVVLLERVFIKLRPWVKGINFGLYMDEDRMVCRNCGGPDLVQRGVYRTAVNSYLTWYCDACGSYSRERSKDQLAPHAHVSGTGVHK